jgi:hypothetical protein
MNMRRTLSLSVALLLAGRLAAPVFAQPTPQVIISHEMTTQDLNLAELAAFDQIAAANPKMAHRLAANPHLVNSESFLDRWPDMKNFLPSTQAPRSASWTIPAITSPMRTCITAI